jgi:hypothetical protein
MFYDWFFLVFFALNVLKNEFGRLKTHSLNFFDHYNGDKKLSLKMRHHYNTSSLYFQKRNKKDEQQVVHPSNKKKKHV